MGHDWHVYGFGTWFEWRFYYGLSQCFFLLFDWELWMVDLCWVPSPFFEHVDYYYYYYYSSPLFSYFYYITFTVFFINLYSIKTFFLFYCLLDVFALFDGMMMDSILIRYHQIYWALFGSGKKWWCGDRWSFGFVVVVCYCFSAWYLGFCFPLR